MDLDLRDKRNRFQVNRVDSTASGHPSGSPGGGGIDGPTLVGYTHQNDGNSCNGKVLNGSCSDIVSANKNETDGVSLSLNTCVLWRKHKSNPSDEHISNVRKDDNSEDANNEHDDLCDEVEGRGDGVSPVSDSGVGCASPAKLISSGHRGSVADQSHFTLSANYDTKYAKSFRHFTREALPRLDNYRNMMSIQAAYRPTLDELHDLTVHGKADGTPKDAVKGEAPGESTMKFGWIKGVFVRCLLNIWGVMLFLRLSWVTGQAGIGQAWVVILLATAVTGITGLSMSAISTNGQIKGAQAMLIIMSTTVVTFITSLSMAAISTNGIVKGGGTYYMISRSLGPEFGASIGLIFSVANAIAAAMYVVGFAESMVDLLDSLGTKVVDDPTNSVRIIGTIAIVVLTCVVVVGMEWEATAQVGLLIILVAAMIDFVIGSFIGPDDNEEISKGFVGYNSSVFFENISPDYRYNKDGQMTFFSVFSIFFPAATGILAGANISGDLADPQYSIPKGTLLAILVTTLSYLLFALIAGACVVRDATGIHDVGGFVLTNDTEIQREYILANLRNCTIFRDYYNETEYTADGCKWGLMNSFQVMELVSFWGPLIYAGCFAATLSSALASLVSAPKVFQALCNDKLYPGLEFFGKGYGKNNEPVRGYVLTFFVALAFILIAELNAIAPLISNFFLAAYALVNFSTFHATLVKPVGWRPTFKYYNLWVSLAGGILCVAVMFLISWVTAILTFAALVCLYMIVIYRKPDVNWGSTTQAQTYKAALSSVQQLNNIEDHVKNYRPQILVLSGLPSVRPPLVDFAYLITKNISLMVCGYVCKSPLNNRQRKGLMEKSQNWFKANRVKSFFTVVDDMSFEDGSKALLQASGVGKLRPNILMLGYKNNWSNCNPNELKEYFTTIHKALDMHTAVTILRVSEGMDFSKAITFGELQSVNPAGNQQLGNPSGKAPTASDECLPRNQSLSQMSQGSSGDLTPSESEKPVLQVDAKVSPKKDPAMVYRNLDGGEVPRNIMESISRFQKKHKHGTIDVWWLYDDGGLTLLLPYIINTRNNWSACKLRVFALANKKDEFDQEQRSMAGLLAKFRIDYSDLKIIPDYNKKPQDSTRAMFDSLIAPFRGKSDEYNSEEDYDLTISETDLMTNKDKCNRHMRLRELLQENSRCSDLVVMTLPMPKKGIVSAPLYMAWLETLTRDMPPFLLVRGNQTSVLTFYS